MLTLLPWRFCATNSLRAFHLSLGSRRSLLTLAIETSCDDTSVAILSKHEASIIAGPTATLHFHQKITADNSKSRGIHPLTALKSHQECLAPLVAVALQHLPPAYPQADLARTIPVRSPVGGEWQLKQKPDFVSVTRGPGMRSSLFTGLDTAKGLALAWQIPLVGVHHMQAHALTPRLVAALEPRQNPSSLPAPPFPFLSLLVSGGHTLLVHSYSLLQHTILATTADIAIGDALDKIARLVCPASLLDSSADVMYGRLLESFAFSHGAGEHSTYIAPKTRGQALARRETPFGWSLPVPFSETKAGSKTRAMEFSFSGLGSAVARICKARGAEEAGREDDPEGMSLEERILLAREAMRVAFEHLASRVVMALGSLETQLETGPESINTLVVSGGVAANAYLRTILRAHFPPTLKITFPPAALCTDNAAMIAWAGMEMWEAGWESDMAVRAVGKWPLEDLGWGEGGEGGWKVRDVRGGGDLAVNGSVDGAERSCTDVKK